MEGTGDELTKSKTLEQFLDTLGCASQERKEGSNQDTRGEIKQGSETDSTSVSIDSRGFRVSVRMLEEHVDKIEGSVEPFICQAL